MYYRLSQSRYKLHIKWATTYTISSLKDKVLKLKKKEGINAIEDALISS